MNAVVFSFELFGLMFALVLFSFFFSMSEMAFSAVNKVRLKTLVDQNVAGSHKALWISENFDRTLTTLLVGNNLANIGLATVSVSFFNGLFQSVPNTSVIVAWVNTLGMTAIVLIFGEIVPKTIARHNPERLALKISGLVYFLIKIMSPITFLFRRLNSRVVRNMEAEGKLTVTEDELETIIDTMEEEGSIDEEEATMLQKVLDLSDITVAEIMTPRVDMIAIDIQRTIDQIIEIFFKHKYSRIPVYDGSSDNIIGILYERDFFTKLIKGQQVNIKKLLKKPLFIPHSTKVDALIELLQLENNHMAIVVDEYGGVDGIVTMEDALEELVGEIYDEHDDVDAFIHKHTDNQYIVNADYDLYRLFEDLSLGEPPVTDSISVGGWLFEQFQEIPEVGDTIEHKLTVNQVFDELSQLVSEDIATLTFEVLKVKKRRIQVVKVTLQIEPEQRDYE
jgi:CBS domain containing-hemolysin-like protein